MFAEEQQVEVHEYRPRGAAYDLFYTYNLEEYDEVLFEGVAGGGKSLAYAHFVNRACIMYPGIQILMVRKYRDTMSESCMKTLEDQVINLCIPVVTQGRDRTQRPHYQYPNGSRIVCCGITDEEKIKSTEWDIVWVNEATEISLPGYEMLLSRLRPSGKRKSPYSLIISDCNPSYAAHWLNQRFMPDPKTKLRRLRLRSSHKDNPQYWDDIAHEWTPEGVRYMAILDSLSGARRERLYKGLWVSEEGLVYEEFEPRYHVINRRDLPTIEYYFSSVDWGFRNAGVMQIWGVDARQAMYLVHETYRTQQTVDFWADEAVRLYLEFRPVAFVCDPASPEKRAQFNDRLSRFRAGKIARLAIEANNDREAGMQEVKSALLRARHAPNCRADCDREDKHGLARLYFCDDALRNGRDPNLATERGRSVCTVDEIQTLVWLKTADGRPIQEKWDDSIPHDGLDALRYAAMFNWQRNAKRRKTTNPFPVGSAGHRLWKEGVKLPLVG
jgi:phage terminase large subunit